MPMAGWRGVAERRSWAHADLAAGSWAAGGGCMALCSRLLRLSSLMRLRLQEHKRELGFLGQRQLENAAAACKCENFTAAQSSAGRRWDVAAWLSLPSAGARARNCHVLLRLQCSVAGSTEDGGRARSASLEIALARDVHDSGSEGPEDGGPPPAGLGAAGDDGWETMLCFEAGEDLTEDAGNGAQHLSCERKGARGEPARCRQVGGRDHRGLMSAVKIFVDSSSLDRCRALVLPALDDLADVADLVSPHALMLASSPCRLLLSFPFPCVLPFSHLLFCKQVCSLPLLDEETTRIVHAMAIEEVSCTWRRFSQCCAWRQLSAVCVLELWCAWLRQQPKAHCAQTPCRGAACMLASHMLSACHVMPEPGANTSGMRSRGLCRGTLVHTCVCGRVLHRLLTR